MTIHDAYRAAPYHHDTVSAFLEFVRNEERVSSAEELNCACDLAWLLEFAYVGEPAVDLNPRTAVEALTGRQLEWFLHDYGNEQIRTILARTIKRYYRFLLIERRIAEDPFIALERKWRASLASARQKASREERAATGEMSLPQTEAKRS